MMVSREGVRNFVLGWRILVKNFKMRNYKILPFVRQNFGMAAVTPATPLTTSLMVSKNFKISWYCEFQVHFGEYCKYFIIVHSTDRKIFRSKFDLQIEKSVDRNLICRSKNLQIEI